MSQKVQVARDTPPGKALKQVLRGTFPDMTNEEMQNWRPTLNGVEFSPLTSGWMTRSYFEGIQLSIRDRRSHRVCRRVILKSNEIDTDAMRRKYEELRIIGEVEREVKEASDKAQRERWEKVDSLKDRLGIRHPDQLRLVGDDLFNLQIYLSEKELEETMKVIHGLRPKVEQAKA